MRLMEFFLGFFRGMLGKIVVLVFGGFEFKCAFYNRNFHSLTLLIFVASYIA